MFNRSVWIGLLGVWGVIATFSAFAIAQTAVPHDLQNIADKPLVAFWSRPSEHLKNPVLAELHKFITESAPPSRDRALLVNLPKIDSLRVSVGQSRSLWSMEPSSQPVIIYHTTDAAASSEIFKILSSGLDAKTTSELKSPIYTHKPFGPPSEQTDPNAWKLQRGVTQLDPQTIVQSDNIELLLKTLTAKPISPPWAGDFVTLAQAQSVYLFDLVQFRELLKDEGGPQGGIEMMVFNSVKALWEQADYAFVKLDTTQGVQLSAFAKSSNAESAQRFKGALEGLIALAKGFLPIAKQELAKLNQIAPGQGDQLYSELEALATSIKVTQNGTQTLLTLSIPQETLARLAKTMMPAIVAARGAALKAQSMNNLRQIALAMHNHLDANRAFPSAVVLGPDGKTTHSWRVAILPFIEEQALFNQYKVDEPWDSENNKKVAATIPAVFRSPNASSAANCTNYVVLTHANGVFNDTPAAKGTKIRQVIDGTSKTIMVVETNVDIPWTKPEDIAIVDGQPLPQLGLPGATTFNAALCDGSVFQLSTKLTDAFRNLVIRNDGNLVNIEDFEPKAGDSPRPGQVPSTPPFDGPAPTKSAVPAPAPPAVPPRTVAPPVPAPGPAPPGIPAPPRVNP
jgi:hypothetical protein